MKTTKNLTEQQQIYVNGIIAELENINKKPVTDCELNDISAIASMCEYAYDEELKALEVWSFENNCNAKLYREYHDKEIVWFKELIDELNKTQHAGYTWKVKTDGWYGDGYLGKDFGGNAILYRLYANYVKNDANGRVHKIEDMVLSLSFSMPTKSCDVVKKLRIVNYKDGLQSFVTANNRLEYNSYLHGSFNDEVKRYVISAIKQYFKQQGNASI